MSISDGQIVTRDIEEEMKNSYTTYAMSVIISRALPDVRDGLKPSQRRILYAMEDLGLEPNKKHRKCAKIAGDTSGNYHPHGEQVIYPTLVRMAQNFNVRYTLVDGQGNFGSIDGDSPAAMRYTEARMTHSATFLMDDIEKDTVDFVPNYDETLKEPSILPGKFPNLLCNGSTGIAVGMATNIPPHNINNVIDGLQALIDDPRVSIDDLIGHVKGPDFPTGGIICGRQGIIDGYHKGRGIIKIRAKAGVEQIKGNKQSIVITEIPYQVNKSNLIESIVSLVQNKVVTSISDIRDESDKDGLRIVIELKRDENAEVLLNQLFKNTQMQVSYGINLLALKDGRPKVLNLKEMLNCHIDHRKDIIVRRTRFELRKAEKRAHILEGLRIAIDHIDEIIALIRASKSTAEARESLIEKFKLSKMQAQAILEMQLQKLTGLEREKIEKEYQELLELIARLKAILASEQEVLKLIREELDELRKKLGDERRTEIINEITDFKVEDLIQDEEMVITITHSGYIKSMPTSTYRKQNRGGRGVTAMGTKEDDFIEQIFIANSHQYILFFTDRGKGYWLKVYEIPEGSRVSRGKAIVNLLKLSDGEKIQSMIPVREFDDQHFLVFISKKGLIKKTNLSNYSRPRKDGIIALTIDDGDELIETMITNGDQELLLASRQGQAIRFHEKDARPLGRGAKGVKGMALKKDNDCVVGAVVLKEDSQILTVTDLGYGKKTDVSEYRLQSRGGSGIKNMKVSSKVGEVMAVKSVLDDDELMMITENSMIVRCAINTVRSCGRNTQGVRLIRLKDGDSLASVASVLGKSVPEAVQSIEVLNEDKAGE